MTPELYLTRDAMLLHTAPDFTSRGGSIACQNSFIEKHKLSKSQVKLVVLLCSPALNVLAFSAFSSSGLVADAEQEHKANEYIDINVTVDGKTMALFGQVTQVSGNEMTLHWLHFDPGEADKLA